MATQLLPYITDGLKTQPTVQRIHLLYVSRLQQRLLVDRTGAVKCVLHKERGTLAGRQREGP